MSKAPNNSQSWKRLDYLEVASLKDLGSVELVDGRKYVNVGFYADSEVGGGEFVYRASEDKANHNGVMVIDPVRVAAWDGTQGDLATLFTAGTGTGCFVRIGKSVSPFDFGAVTTALVDNSLPLNAFFAFLFDQTKAGVTYSIVNSGFSFGVSSGIKYTFTGVTTAINPINLGGMEVYANADYDNLSAVFELVSEGLVRNLAIFNGKFDGKDVASRVAFVDGGNKTLSEFLYNFILYFCKFRGGIDSSLEVTGNVFEGAIVDCHGSLNNTTGKVFNIYNTAPSTLSSIEIRGGSTRGGINGLYTDIGDVKLFGGTYILSGEYAVRCQSGTGALLEGVHVENAWEDGTGTGNAGIFLSGQGVINHCLGTSNNGIMDTLCTVFSAPNAQVIGGAGLGGVSDILLVRQNSRQLSVSNVKRSRIKYQNVIAERNIAIQEKGRYLLTNTVSGTVTPDLDDHDVYGYNLTGDTTIANPLNSTIGDEITLRIQQDVAGGRSVTLGSEFEGAPTISTGPSKKTILKYFYNGDQWELISQETY